MLKILILKDKVIHQEDRRECDSYHDQFMKESACFVMEALKDSFQVAILEVEGGLKEKLKIEKPDLVFNLANGENLPGGIDAVPNLLDELGIPYTGSSGAAHLRAYDKTLTMKVLKSMGVLVPKFQEVSERTDLSRVDLPYPILIKPKDGGYSRGIYNENLVFTKEELVRRVNELLDENYKELLLTEYIEGRELTLGVLGSGEDLEMLPPMEVSFENLPEDLHSFYSFEAKVTYEKYIKNNVPAVLDKHLLEELAVTSRHIFRVLGLSDYARLDIRIREGRIYLLEVNSLPGLHKDTSDIVKMYEAEGKTYKDLILTIVNSALRRFHHGVNGRLISGL